MKDLILFPYNNEATWIVKNKDIIKNYRLLGISTIHEDEEIATAFAIEHGIQYAKELREFQYDSILFLDNIGQNPLKAYYKRLKESIDYGKEILMTHDLYNELVNANYEISSEMISFLGNHSYKEDEQELLYDINIPIILICSLGENCNKMEVQLDIMRHFISRGYQVTAVASNEVGSLFQTHTIPRFILEEEKSNKESIVGFNHFIHQIEQDEKPDLIIIGVPGSIMPMNNFIMNNFGLLSYQISSAVPPDVCIVGANFSTYLTDEYFENLRNFCQYRLNTAKSYFYISSQKIRYQKSEKELDTYFLEDSLIKKIYRKNNLSKNDIPCIVEEVKMKQLYNKITNELQNNVAII